MVLKNPSPGNRKSTFSVRNMYDISSCYNFENIRDEKSFILLIIEPIIQGSDRLILINEDGRHLVDKLFVQIHISISDGRFRQYIMICLFRKKLIKELIKVVFEAYLAFDELTDLLVKILCLRNGTFRIKECKRV